MTHLFTRSLPCLAMAGLIIAGTTVADSPRPPRKKVLVELYTSQGCNMCPKADAMLGQLNALGVSAERLVPLAFHVDYFNTPWKDRFSDHAYSERQYEYSLIYNRENKLNNPNYLYFTPMLMVDGRAPMLGSDQPKAQKALQRALSERPAASIEARLEDDPRGPRRKTLTVAAGSLSSKLNSRDVLIGAAVWENPLSTRVASGENAGKTLVEHYAVRKFVYRITTLERGKRRELSFPLELGDDWTAEHCGVAILIQDVKNGQVYQAESLPWSRPAAASR